MQLVADTIEPLNNHRKVVGDVLLGIASTQLSCDRCQRMKEKRGHEFHEGISVKDGYSMKKKKKQSTQVHNYTLVDHSYSSTE